MKVVARSPSLSAPPPANVALYQFVEWQRAWLQPWAAWAHGVAQSFADPANPLTYLPGAPRVAASYELLHRLGKAYEQPKFNLQATTIAGHRARVIEQTVRQKPFCRLLRFARQVADARILGHLRQQPEVLVCAPLAGHHATMLHDMVRTLLPAHRVYVTEWIDARMVPLTQGAFALNDYVRYMQDFIRQLGASQLHVIAICQSTVPVLAAVALMASAGEPTPRTLTLIGGPIDARRAATAVNRRGATLTREEIVAHRLQTVPAHYPGAGRTVYPGFLQHASFAARDPARYVASHWAYYVDRLCGGVEEAEARRCFYDDYSAELDMAAEFYLDTIQVVFRDFRLARGTWRVHGEPVRPQDIRHTALLTIEGERDDIAGCGPTQAAHDLCAGLPAEHQHHYTAPRCDHYELFCGQRWHADIYPRVHAFIQHFAPASPSNAGLTNSA